MLYDIAPDAEAHPELGVLIATWRDSTREWRENLGRVSKAAVTWQPYENSPSIGGILLHMIDSEAYWLRQFAAGEPEDAESPEAIYNAAMDQYKHSWPKPPAQPLAWYYEIQDLRREENLAYVREQVEPAEVFSGRRNVFTYRWIVAHLVEHDAYHGGQAVLLHEMFKRMRKA